MYKSNIEKNYKTEIDGLRAFAVIAVIINHTYSPILPNGFLGVDIFFVISGFVLTLSLEAKRNKNLIEFLTNFFYRRIKRLLPALLVFCLITAIISTFLIPSPKFAHITGITGLLGFSNLYLLNGSTDYFATDVILNPFTHTWSLDVEEQFYLIFPFLIWFSGFGSQKYHGKKNLFYTMLFLSSLSLIFYVYLTINYPISSYYLMPARFWEMGAGSILFLIYKSKNILISKISQIPSGLFLISISVIMLLPIKNLSINTFLIVFLTIALILSLKEENFISRIFNCRIANHLGLISYSLYLWHWAILSISAWTIGVHWWTIPFQFGIIYFVSFLSFKYVEQPFRKNNILKKKWKLFLSSFFLVFGSVSFIAILSLKLKDYIFLGNKSLADNYSEKVLWDYNNCSVSSRDLQPPNFQLLNNCWFKKSYSKFGFDKEKQIFFYGSSYNQHLMSIPAEISKKSNEFKFNSFVATGCIASIDLDYSEGNNEYCNKVFRKYLNFFKEASNEGDQLFIANSYNSFINNEKLLDTYIEELEDIYSYFEENNLKLIVVSPIPVIKPNPTICSNWYAKYNNQCNLKNILDISENNKLRNINKKLNKLKDKKIIYLNLFDDLENKLLTKDRNYFLFFYNKSHLSKTGAKFFTKKFETIFSN